MLVIATVQPILKATVLPTVGVETPAETANSFLDGSWVLDGTRQLNGQQPAA